MLSTHRIQQIIQGYEKPEPVHEVNMADSVDNIIKASSPSGSFKVHRIPGQQSKEWSREKSPKDNDEGPSLNFLQTMNIAKAKNSEKKSPTKVMGHKSAAKALIHE